MNFDCIDLETKIAFLLMYSSQAPASSYYVSHPNTVCFCSWQLRLPVSLYVQCCLIYSHQKAIFTIQFQYLQEVSCI